MQVIHPAKNPGVLVRFVGRNGKSQSICIHSPIQNIHELLSKLIIEYRIVVPWVKIDCIKTENSTSNNGAEVCVQCVSEYIHSTLFYTESCI